MNITERQIQALEALARYKYLTINQLAYIFGLKSNSNIHVFLKDLSTRKKPLVESKGFGVIPVHGRLSRVFFLTKYGKDFLVEILGYSEESIKFVQNRHSLFQRDYFHRCDTVNFNIYFQKWLESEGYELDFFTYYFDKSGSNRNGTGEIANVLELGKSKIIPDGIGLFRTPERPYLFLFEQHNGKDAKRAIRQILAHCVAISEGVASDKYFINTASRVFYVFEDKACMLATMAELRELEDFEGFDRHFLFQTTAIIEANFADGWLYTDNTRTPFI